MPLPYYYPTNLTGFVDMISYGNYLTGYWLTPMLLMAIFLIAFISLRRYSDVNAFSSAMFITAMTSTFFVILGIIATEFMIVLWLLTAVFGGLLTYFEKKE